MNSLESQVTSIVDGRGEEEGNIASFDKVSQEGASTAGSSAKLVEVCKASTSCEEIVDGSQTEEVSFSCGEIVDGLQTEEVSVVALTDFFTVFAELVAVAVDRFFLTAVSTTSFLRGVPVCRDFAIMI